GVIQGGVCTGEVKDIAEVNYLWAANDWLSGLGDGEVLYNRASTQFTSDPDQRHIFTWYDSNNDGVVDDQEVLPFETEFIAGLEEDAYNSLGVSGETEVENIVEWLRGRDQEGLRSREIDIKGNVGTWRLGDIVHSTPTAVSRPAEGYQFLYLDNSYARFASRYNNRRHMIYFGGNDGMLHAVNGGFFNIGEKKFCKTSDCQDEDQGLPLGAEVWSYVPYNLWPHLKCLADPEYGHKYYVDQVPRIFDVQIFEEEPICSTDLHNPGCTYPGGWGTILVGGMRFGGEETTVNGRTFTSAYFILDITNPEQPPRLLGEMTFTGSEDEADMGFTTSVPTMVPMVNRQDGTSEWYLVLGSGPTDLKGVSDQPGRVGVISLRELVNTTPGDPFRIPADPPEADGKQIGSFALTGHENSFVSDLITVDFNFDYLADSVYFGTVAGDFNLSEGGWDGGGKVYRLVTEKLDSSGKQVPSEPHEWATLLESHVDGLSNPLPLIDVGEPVTAAPAAAWDGSNYWIYFGTGRLFNREDLKDQDSYSYFGIKEPVDCETGRFTWETVDFTVLDKDSFDILSTTPGERGLLRVDEIEVLGGENASTADLICTDGTYDCLPSQVSTFAQLRSYIAGYDCESGTDGWYRKFHDTGERNLGQATVLGGLLTFSTYLPSQDPCSPEGFSDLYAFYYQTGTPWYRSVFTSFTVEEDVGEPVEYRQRIGPGLAVTPSLHVGADRGAKAFLQTSTGAIIGVEQPELPLSDYKTGRESWREIYRNILVIDETGEVQ
ncbi:MAG: pilus assembly protein, partial [Thermodesulfobacteriota bacterium]